MQRSALHFFTHLLLDLLLQEVEDCNHLPMISK